MVQPFGCYGTTFWLLWFNLLVAMVHFGCYGSTFWLLWYNLLVAMVQHFGCYGSTFWLLWFILLVAMVLKSKYICYQLPLQCSGLRSSPAFCLFAVGNGNKGGTVSDGQLWLYVLLTLKVSSQISQDRQVSFSGHPSADEETWLLDWLKCVPYNGRLYIPHLGLHFSRCDSSIM